MVVLYKVCEYELEVATENNGLSIVKKVVDATEDVAI